jgi:hypothetical protein
MTIMTKLENKKISQKLLQLIKPYMKVIESSNPEQRLYSLLLVGSTSWNIAVTGNDELKNILLGPIDDPEGLLEMETTIRILVERKKRLFPDDDRIILDCKINSAKKKKSDITVSFLSKDEFDKSPILH